MMQLQSDISEHFDVLIIGAGLSGIGAAYHLQERCPDKTYAILEGRAQSGGTWDLFRYPGIRSDSDMYTLGYRFRPWRKAETIAGGPSILEYLRDTAAEYGIDKKIRYEHWITDVSWSSETATWTVTVMLDGAPQRYTCNFLWMCAGYYRYSAGYTPEFKGVERFKGRIIHPQLWPDDVNYEGKRVVVIGSGATAVTLIPSMADKTAHITMLQRSPTYMYAMSAESSLAKFLNFFLPRKFASALMRWQRIILQRYVFWLARTLPGRLKNKLIDMAREKLPEGYDVEKHFTPRYNPWEQRLCLVPDDDLFEAISSGRASVVTDEIETFTENGVALKSGDELEADIIITATGLVVESAGGANVVVDGQNVKVGDQLTYKGLMYEGVPNLVSVFGYSNSSWTLRADLISDYVCRLINHMGKHGIGQATPRNEDPDIKTEPFFDFSSGYVKRGEATLPKQGAYAPWRHPQNYFTDIFSLRFGKLEDGFMEFKEAPSARCSAHQERMANPAQQTWL